VVKKLDLGTVVSLGRPKLKNIAERFRMYALLPAPPAGLRQKLQVQRLKFTPWRRPVQAVVAVLCLVGAGIIGRHFYIPAPTGLPFPDKPSIVVLPFTNMSGGPEQEYFSDGITGDITTGLAKISSLFVIARNSAFTYKGQAVKVQDVSKELGVQYILEGSVRRADEQVRVTVQLIDGLTGGHLWAERFDRPLKEVFAVQDEIVQKIVMTLKLQLSLMEQGRLVRKHTDHLEAYDSYLRGVASLLRAFYGTKKEENEQARQMFEKATQLDPHYAEAYEGLGMVSFLDWFYQWKTDPAQSLERSFELAQRAIALDDSLPGPHEVLGMAYLWKKQHQQAITAAERAIALDPNFARGYATLGRTLAFAGRAEEGLGWIEQEMRLDPRWPSYFADLGWAYRVAGRYEEALVSLKKVLTLRPNLVSAHVDLTACYVELGREEEARAEAAEVLRIAPHVSVEVFKQSLPYKEPADLERFVAALRKAGLP
jgi:adenylate cyclase